ncbi:hypothetical protein J6O48_09925 [bacterium]|nr:hypothetical protein [bacterium]
MFDYLYYSIFGYSPYYNQISSNIDWANVIVVLLSGIIGAFGAIYVGNKNNETQRELSEKQLKIQKELWSKDAYIKYEAEVITECKKIYNEVCKYIWHFEGFFISPLAFIYTEDECIKKFQKNNCYEYYHKPFEKFYNIFKKNKQIFVKYGLDKAFEGINFYMYLLSVVKPIKTITYTQSKIPIRDLNKNVDIPAFKAEFWYAFPYLTYQLVNNKGVTFNAHCTKYEELITPEVMDTYEKVLVYYSHAIKEMDDILNKIMLIGKVNNDILPTYLHSYSLSHYIKDSKGSTDD